MPAILFFETLAFPGMFCYVREKLDIFFERLSAYALHCKRLPDSRPIDRKKFILDSATISLFSNIMHGAGSYKGDNRKKGGAKAHVVLAAEHNIPSVVRNRESKHHDLVFLQNLPIPSDSVLFIDMAYINYLKFTEWGKRPYYLGNNRKS